MALEQQLSDIPNPSTPNGDETTLQTSHQDPGSLHCTFTSFPKPPAELRLKIWAMALNVPHVIFLAPSKNFQKWLDADGSDIEGNDVQFDDADENAGIKAEKNDQVAHMEQASRYPRGAVGVVSTSAIEDVTDEWKDVEGNEDDEDIDDDNVPSAGIVASQTGPPSLLHVCQESRLEASQVYMQYCDKVLLKVVEYQTNIDILLLDNPHIFHAFLNRRLRIFGYNKPPEHIPITSITIKNVDFRSRYPDGSKTSNSTPCEIGFSIVDYDDLQRVTFITDASGNDTQPRQLLIQPPKRVIPDKFADRTEEERRIAFEIHKENLQSMTYGDDPNDDDAFLFNVRAAAQSSRLCTTSTFLPVVLECCTWEQFQARYK